MGMKDVEPTNEICNEKSIKILNEISNGYGFYSSIM